jgi:hypothetical protein
MYEKYRLAHFGRCPHVFCQGQPVLPVGLSDLPRNYTVNVFCPRCHGLYFPKSTRQANIDGAYFGTTFPHLYLMTHPVSTIGAVLLVFFFAKFWGVPFFAQSLYSVHCVPTCVKIGYGTNETSANVPATCLRIPCQCIQCVLYQS